MDGWVTEVLFDHYIPLGLKGKRGFTVHSTTFYEP